MANLYVTDGGDLRVEDEDGNVVGRYDESANEWEIDAPLVGGTSGATVYDDSTQTVGDGTTSAHHDSIDADTSLKLPTYSDNTNAVQENESLWYNDGTGPDASGYYAYDGGLIGPFGEGGEWQEDGSGNIVPIDGETIGDGTTSAEHESVSTETIGSERHYAGSYDGGDPDARLDNALSAAFTGDVIYLENASYLNTHTISTDGLTIFGTAARLRGTQIKGGITVSADYVEFIDLYWSGGTHQLNGSSNSIRRGSINSGAADITIDGVLSIVEGVVGGSVTLGSNSIQCVVDSCAAFSVTDNGTANVVGDLS